MGMTILPLIPHSWGGVDQGPGQRPPCQGWIEILREKRIKWHRPLFKDLTLNLSVAIVLEVKWPELGHSASPISKGSWVVWPLFWEAVFPRHMQIFYAEQRENRHWECASNLCHRHVPFHKSHFCLDKRVPHSLLSEVSLEIRQCCQL